MHILGISGSPKRRGLTNLLLDNAIDGARREGAVTEKIILNDLNFRACQECGGCDNTGICVLDDDMKPVYDKIAAADAMIVASPIYFGTVTAQLKAMIDRLQCSWVAKYVLKKKTPLRNKRKGIFLCVGGNDKKEYFEDAKKVVKIMFAVLDIKYSGDLFVGGTNILPSGSAKKDKAFQKAFDLGVMLASK